MNIQNNLSYYIDATNEFIGGGGGGTASNIIINGGAGGVLNDYLYTSNSGGNIYQLYLNTPHTDGDIRFSTKLSKFATNNNFDHSVKIDKDGKLFVYHVYNPLLPTYSAGWKDVESALSDLVGLTIGTEIQFAAVGATLLQVESSLGNLLATDTIHYGLIDGLEAQIVSVETAVAELTTVVEELYGATFEPTDILSQSELSIRNAYGSLDRYVNQAANFGVVRSAASDIVFSFADKWTNYFKSKYKEAAITAVIGVAGGIIAAQAIQEQRNIASNMYSSNFQITDQERRILLDDVDFADQSNMIYLNSNFCNMTISHGFINSNIIDTQFIPSLKSNKILMGNITTPNSAYQLEMTGDLNTNMLYINSVSLSSLLNQKQDNMSATQPIYITTSTIGLNYDSSLTKVGNNLSVVKTATTPLAWTGNNIALSYDSTLTKVGNNLSVAAATASKWTTSGNNIYNNNIGNVGINDTDPQTRLSVMGDSYISGITTLGLARLNPISSYTGATLTLATGTSEYYLQYTANGTLVLSEPIACDIFMVGAGGNGGSGASSGGGGAGEVIYYQNFPLRNGTLTINVGTSSTTPANRISSITHSSGTQISAKGGGNGGSPNFYTTSGGTVSALTAISGTADAYISITAGTTLTLNASCSADILVVGGGAAGAWRHGGGGGAGAVIYLTNESLNSGSYTITIGAGGTGASSGSAGYSAARGSDTSITLSGTTIYLAKGGGVGEGEGGVATSGGSGGGGVGSTPGSAVNTNIPSGTYGYSGGNGSTGGSDAAYSGGGGGGGGAVGGNSSLASGVATAGNGGIGRQLSITGTNTYYGGGGGGGCASTSTAAGSGGNGGGGAGSKGVTTATNGTPNTGGGGGGSGFAGASNGRSGDGGSGIVIIRFKNYLTINGASSGGGGGGGGKNQSGASAGVKFDDYKSFALAGLSGNSTTGGNGGAGNTTYSRYTTTITGSSLSVALGGTGVGASPATPTTKTNYGDGGDGNGGVGFQGIVIIRFKVDSNYLQIKSIKDNANSGLILNANESPNVYQLRVYSWSDTYTSTGIAVRGWSMRVHDGNNHLDLLNLFSSFGGRIGIKTKNPTATFDVNGDINCKTFNVIGNELYGITCQVVNQHDTGEASINVSAGASGNYGAMSVVYLPSQNLGYISCSKSLQIKTQSVGSYIHIDNTTGYVGIGNNLPQAKLHVSGTILSSSISVTTVNADSVAAGNISCTSLDLNNGSIIDCNRLNSVDVWTGPVKATSLDLDGGNITNGGFFYGMAQQARFLNMSVNEWHYDTQSRNRFYFTNDGTSSHTVFRTGSTTHYFQDKDATDYCLLDRFGISTYFEVISGGGYDNVGVVDASSTGVYVYRKMFVRLSTFTEVHRCFCEDELYTNYDDFINEFVGRVVVSKGKIKTALKEADKQWEIFEDKDGITIDDSHPVIELSRKKKDKAVVGVITKRNQNNDLPNRLVINSLGETAIWVVNSGGCIETGDLITTSDELGYAEKQDCDFIKNYTIGKCMISCDFELDNPNYKCEIIDAERDLRRAYLPIFIYSG